MTNRTSTTESIERSLAAHSQNPTNRVSPSMVPFINISYTQDHHLGWACLRSDFLFATQLYHHLQILAEVLLQLGGTCTSS